MSRDEIKFSFTITKHRGWEGMEYLELDTEVLSYHSTVTHASLYLYISDKVPGDRLGFRGIRVTIYDDKMQKASHFKEE